MFLLSRNRAAPRLSGIVVTQDDAGTIGTVLDQLEGICDEIVVVDGGSVDGTPELAAAHPAVRLHHRAFDGDFASQKNFALDRARGDWLFVLDTDELLSPRLLERVPRLVRRRFPLWYRFPRAWLLQRDGRWVRVRSARHEPDWQVRLFRNRRELRYQPGLRRVHHLLPAARGRRGAKVEDAPLLHFTLELKDQAAQREKALRYTELEPETADLNRAYLWQGDEQFVPWERGEQAVLSRDMGAPRGTWSDAEPGV